MYFREFVGIFLSILYVIIQIFTATFFQVPYYYYSLETPIRFAVSICFCVNSSR